MSTLPLNTLKKIGILGGTFDPPHLGHLKLASYFASKLELDELLLIPSGQPWQKDSGITSAQIRLQLTEAAAIDLARAFLYRQMPTKIGVDRLEVDRAGPSYSIDTAKSLRERYGPDASLIWLAGADTLLHLPSWFAWRDLLNYVHFAVASRPKFDLDTDSTAEIVTLLKERQTEDPKRLEKSPAGLIYIDSGLAVDLSSTELRKHLQSPSRNAIASEQIPSHALEIITKLGLYQ